MEAPTRESSEVTTLTEICDSMNETKSKMSDMATDITAIKTRLNVNSAPAYSKLIMDPVHGSMVFDEKLLIKIIDTPQFQRLRKIKQLGGCYYVFPGGAHNRFEHSLGVCYLAGEFIRTLHRNQPELNITDRDMLCVQIAGLCHDLGHGPFSHVFDMDFIPRRKRFFPELEDLKHEELSTLMFDHLIEENDLKAHFRDECEITAIKRMIRGIKDGDTDVPAEKRFLYQIVANKPTGIDVDKWDYFARDCHQLGITNSFDHKRCMKFARVIKQDDAWLICFRNKEADNLYQMFHVRYMLHRRAYQHRVTKIIEHMIMDAFEEADDAGKCFKIFPAKDGVRKLNMTETLMEKDMHAYTFMTDSILDHIQQTTEVELEKARNILENVDKRKLYKLVYENLIPSEIAGKFTQKYPPSDIADKLEAKPDLRKDLIVVKMVKINYGQKDKNPMQNVYFYNKSKPNIAFKIDDEDISLILPKAFQEIFIRIYCKDPKQASDAKKPFMAWYKEAIASLKRELDEERRGTVTPADNAVAGPSRRNPTRKRPSETDVTVSSKAKKKLNI